MICGVKDPLYRFEGYRKGTWVVFGGYWLLFSFVGVFIFLSSKFVFDVANSVGVGPFVRYRFRYKHKENQMYIEVSWVGVGWAQFVDFFFLNKIEAHLYVTGIYRTSSFWFEKILQWTTLVGYVESQILISTEITETIYDPWMWGWCWWWGEENELKLWGIGPTWKQLLTIP